MKKTVRFELCAENLESAKIAEAGGADRVELCRELAIGGLTPATAVTQEAVQTLSIPVHVLIRPRGGDFVYTDAEFALMRRETLEAKAAGAAAIVVGILLPDGRVDVRRTREIAELAKPMHVTFHRAFDESAELTEALEDVIRTGADCLLTSGGQPTVMEGAEQIAILQRQAGDRLTIMAGGGLTLANLVELVRITGVTYLHGSLQRKDNDRETEAGGTVHLEDVREAIRLAGESSECLMNL